ncbi:probable poly(beta-D-mannuronate) O-acetylase [Lachnospiraceae bacterium KM106-2]|nr:probable poly(beta-D-mannuronate) O-acetylase [Lachnospiraceae bacterium KM106-2]
MLFSSNVFIFYFLPIVLLLYYACRWSRGVQNGILLVASLFFYAWGEPWFVLIMIASIFLNYLFALIIDWKRENKRFTKCVLTISVICNLALLLVFKYTDFFIRNINEVTGAHLPLAGLALPLGISFFTFQAMSYVVDVYRETGKVQKNPFWVALYIAFFPQLVAGPIVRYSTIDEQIHDRIETWNKFSVGVCRFIAGLSKKVLLSNNFAIIADHIFDSYQGGGCPISLAWLGAIAYTLQILFDFSGYSDMAIGLGLMFGFKFEENFDYPYISRSIGEFWRRWHISLGNWFKEYLYFPLGGSKVKNKDIVIRNMLVVWLCTGFWHGAEWTFVIWGLLNFVALIFERFTEFEYIQGHNFLKWLYTMFVVVIGWVIFRAENLVYAGNYLASMFGFFTNDWWSDSTWMFVKENFVFFVAGIIFCMPLGRRYNKMIVEKKVTTNIIDILYPVAMMLLFLICVSYLVKGSYNPFIYFNF